MERTLWTDERLDDVINRIDSGFDRLERDIGDMRREMHDMGRELRGEISSNLRQLSQIGWAMVGILIVQLIAAVVALST